MIISMTREMKSIPDSFCVAPWISLHVDSQSKRRLCCATSVIAPQEFQHLSAEEFAQSSYLKSIREKMLQGKFPKECNVCQTFTPKSLSYQQSLNQIFADEILQILQYSQTSFYDYLFFDYREATCNLKCKTCGPESSSSWSTFIKKSDLFRRLYLKSEQEPTNNSFEPSVYAEFLPLVGKSKNLRRLYFAGGEPLLAKEHLRVLEYLVTSGRSKKISLLYNSNLMHPLSTLEKMAALWENFHEVLIRTSIDGVGDVGEYIRTGAKNDVIIRNVEFLLQLGKKFPLRVEWDITATSLLFSQLLPMADFLLNHPCPYNIREMQWGEWKAKFLRLEFLTIAEREKRVRAFEEFYQRLSVPQQSHLFRFRQFLNQTLKIPEFSEVDYEDARDLLFFHELEFGPPPSGSIQFRTKELKASQTSNEEDENPSPFHAPS